jgi:VanZ family protein
LFRINHLAEPPRIITICYYWLPPLLLTAGIFIMAGDLGSMGKFKLPAIILHYLLPSWSRGEITQLYGELRKVGHFLAYAALFGAYVRAWRWHMQMPRYKAVLLALTVCLLVSAGDEGRQAFYASRTGNPRDVVLDMSGALAAAIALFPLLRPEDPLNE